MENQYLNFWGYLSQWKWLLVWGIISLLVGIYFAFQPSQAYLFIASLFGISLLVGGIFQMMTATNDRDVKGWRLLFIAGLLDIILGAYLVLNANRSELFLTVLFAIILFYRGIIYIRASMKMKNNHRQWGLYLFNGILLLIISIFLLAFPLFSMLGIVMVSSILMIYWGFTWIWMAFEIKPKKTIDE